ncbi:hypothetical protein LXL04_033733 [Taraxacum kok-saghyz]
MSTMEMVLHMDRNDYYGGESTSLNLHQLWKRFKGGDAPPAELGQSKDYNVDMVPKAFWDHILIPVARHFKPDIILVSAGFDAALGDPLGGCRITPNGYAIMLKKLMEFSEGKIVMPILSEKLPEKLTSKVSPMFK